VTIKYVQITKITADEARAYRDLKFTIKCKNTGHPHTYNLNNKCELGSKKIISLFSWAMYKNRHSQGHFTRISVIEKFQKFLQFASLHDITSPSDLDGTVLINFCLWLKNESGLKYSTAGSLFRSISSIFKQWQKHKSISPTFIIPENMFPKSSGLSSSNEGYDMEEIREISTAVQQSLVITSKRLESTYKPQWLGKEPPITDVAPVITNKKKRSVWASKDYCIWFWVNELHCEKLNIESLYKIPRGQSFLKGISNGTTYYAKALKKFYKSVSDTDYYINNFAGKPSPIKYNSPWQKTDYLVWYWENIMQCQVLSDADTLKKYPLFYHGFRHRQPGWLTAFYNENNLKLWVSASDLTPYYLMLLIRTGLNPSTISRLTLDCLEVDPLDSNRMFIRWEKYRSNKKDKTIPLIKGSDSWPIRIIQRVIKITESYRPKGQQALWISNASSDQVPRVITVRRFQQAIYDFGVQLNLKRPSDSKPITLQASLFRPTMAWQEYLRTEDLTYLQALLAHTRLKTTSDYLRKLNDPIFKARRGLHLEAMLLGLEGDNDDPFSRLPTEIDKPQENLLNHCKDPLNSPQKNQFVGVYCSSATETCLGCQNLVITQLDIKKYFSYLNYHQTLLALGEIKQDEFNLATQEKQYMWDTYILPKYDKSIVEMIRSDAIHNPVPEWSINNIG
tara:strand:- start:268 stop:2298 length:2031 start_codon:yes stop_codon:yes gene_type:complete